MISIVFTISLIVIFLHECTRPGMIFSFVASSLDHLPSYLRKPLYDCPICMIPWWGPSILALGIIGKLWYINNVLSFFIVIGLASGVNIFLVNFLNVLKSAVKMMGQTDCHCENKEKKAEERRQRIYSKLS